MTKAFDLVKHSVLFKKLMIQGLAPIFIRLLLVMYVLQSAKVRWNGKTSKEFTMRNGVKQGAVISTILYCVYMNGLFEKMRENRTGCWMGQHFMGITGYADDNVLLSPTLDGLQEMLETCEKYAKEYNLKFSTDPNPKKCKTKCISFLYKDRPLRKMRLCGDDLNWVPNG